MISSIQAAPSTRLSQIIVTATYGLLGLWAVYLLLAPTTGFYWIDSWHNEQRAVQIILLSLTAMAFAGLSTLGPVQFRSQLHLPRWWWAFVAIGAVSALVSRMSFAAFAEVGLFVLLSVLVMLTAALTAHRPEKMARAARYCALLLSAAHVLAVAVRVGAALQLGNGIDLSVFMLGYANPRFASALYAVLIPFVAGIAIDGAERFSLRTTAFVVLCLLWVINLGLGTRGIWFAYGLAVPAVALLIGLRPMSRVAGAIALAAMIGLVIYLAMLSIGSAGNGEGAAALAVPTERLYTLTSREVLWALSWEAIQQHPLLGLGPMHFATLDSRVGAHPHNWPLQIASEWGVPALLLLLFALVRQIRCLIERSPRAPGSTEAWLAVAVALLYGLVDGNLVMPVSQSGIAIAVGLAVGSQDAKFAGPYDRNLKSAPILVNLITVVACLVVYSYAFKSFGDQAHTSAQFRSSNPGDWLVPRFWEQGLL